MPTQIVLHVGMPKTATTTIQYSFDAQSAQLSQAGAIFPKSGRFEGRGPAHHAFFVPCARGTVPAHLPDPGATLAEMQAKVERERQSAGATSIILSSEMLWNSVLFDRAALAQIRDVFPDCEFIVVAYLRPVESHVLSGYAQRVTGPQRYTGSLKEHAAELFARGGYDYIERLGDFAEVFGQEAVRPVWLPGLHRDVLAPFREIFPQLGAISAQKDQNIRRGWLFVTLKRRLNLLEGGFLHRPARTVERLLARLDSRVGKASAIDKLLEPMDTQTHQKLEQHTAMVLEGLQTRYKLTGF